MKKNRRVFLKPEIDKIRLLASQGIEGKRIAVLIGREYKTLHRKMVELHIPRQPRNRFPTRDSNPAWKGGFYFDRDGYVCSHVPSHPFARGKGYVREHRLVMEKHLGRYLTESEVVHHRDGDKKNNSLQNLQLFARNADHLKHELTGRVPKWTPEGRRRILAAVHQRRRNPV